MKRMIVVMAVLAVVLAALAPSVSADEFQNAMQNVFDTANAPVRGMAENFCDAHRGTGDAMEASWCYGYVLDSRGRVTGYNPNSVRGLARRGFRVGDMYRSRYSQQYGSPYGYGYGGYGYDPYGYGPSLSGRTTGAIVGGVAGALVTRNSNSTLARVGGIVGGAVLGGVIGNKLENRNDRPRDSRSEDVSDCVKRTTKEFKKAGVAFSSDQVIAACSGQSVRSGRAREEEAAPEAYAPEPPPAPQTTPAPRQSVERQPAAAQSVFIQGDKLCNDTDETIAIYVDGSRVGNLAPRRVVSLSRLPKGRVSYFPIG